jgi:hypothetical protein
MAMSVDDGAAAAANEEGAAMVGGPGANFQRFDAHGDQGCPGLFD